MGEENKLFKVVNKENISLILDEGIKSLLFLNPDLSNLPDAKDVGYDSIHLINDNPIKVARFIVGLIYQLEGGLGKIRDHHPFDKYAIIEVNLDKVHNPQESLHETTSSYNPDELVHIIETKKNIPKKGIASIAYVSKAEPSNEKIQSYHKIAQEFFEGIKSGDLPKELEETLKEHHQALFSHIALKEYLEKKVTLIKNNALKLGKNAFVENYIKSKIYEIEIEQTLKKFI